MKNYQIFDEHFTGKKHWERGLICLYIQIYSCIRNAMKISCTRQKVIIYLHRDDNNPLS